MIKAEIRKQKNEMRIYENIIKKSFLCDYYFSNVFFKTAAVIIIVASTFCSAFSLENALLKGQVLDVEGNAVKGAEIFIYNNPDTRRPADFISARTGLEGRFSMTVPAGRYWAVARLRTGEKYGPLMLGDKHSGEPVEIEIETDEEFEQDFTIMDIREAARLIRKTREDYFMLRGRIIDKKGNPLKNVYAVANREMEISETPDYLSAWTDEEGRYTLYLPAGTYYIGYAAEFPPGVHYKITEEFHVESKNSGINIIADPEKDF